MEINSEGKNLLNIHGKLFSELIKIPKDREMIYIEDKKMNFSIAKPRFKPPKYLWPKDLLISLRNHLQNIWNFFEKYSYWFDDTIIPLLHIDKRRMSKKSIIFLLQEDVWCTDEVYGDYLVWPKESGILISYIRRDKFLQQVILQLEDQSEIEEWVLKDAIRQIQNQFTFLWKKLKIEIQSCIEELYHKPPKSELSSSYIKEQLSRNIKVAEKWAEAGLLSLGRLAELWLLTKLELKSTPYQTDLIREAELVNIIDKNEVKLLRKIRSHYNNLKHKSYYKCEPEEIKRLITQFSNLFILK